MYMYSRSMTDSMPWATGGRRVGEGEELTRDDVQNEERQAVGRARARGQQREHEQDCFRKRKFEKEGKRDKESIWPTGTLTD